MKKLLLLTLCAITLTAYSADWDNPSVPFNASNNKHKTSIITWRAVDNVQSECAKEILARDGKKLTYAVDACSFWVGNNCTIITKKNPTMHSVGHEVRHCFQEQWH